MSVFTKNRDLCHPGVDISTGDMGSCTGKFGMVTFARLVFYRSLVRHNNDVMSPPCVVGALIPVSELGRLPEGRPIRGTIWGGGGVRLSLIPVCELGRLPGGPIRGTGWGVGRVRLSLIPVCELGRLPEGLPIRGTRWGRAGLGWALVSPLELVTNQKCWRLQRGYIQIYYFL